MQVTGAFLRFQKETLNPEPCILSICVNLSSKPERLCGGRDGSSAARRRHIGHTSVAGVDAGLGTFS